MTDHREQITAWLAAAQAREHFAARLPWRFEQVRQSSADLICDTDERVSQGGPVEDGGDYFGALDVDDAHLIVFATNLLPGLITYVRDVLDRHPVAQSRSLKPPLTQERGNAALRGELPDDDFTFTDICGGHEVLDYLADECPDVKALATALGIEP